MRISFAAARFLTTFFVVSRSSFARRFCKVETRGDACEYFRALLTHSLSLSPILLQLYRDVQETCVKLGFLYPNAKTSDPVQRRADCVTMFRVVGCTCASTLFWCLASAFSRLFCLSLSLSLSCRSTAFASASAFNQPLAGWDVSSVVYLNSGEPRLLLVWCFSL